MASIRKLSDGRWQAQFRPVPGGKQVTRTTRRKADAQRWLDEQTASVITGAYADPRSGRVTFGEFYEDWSARQVWENNSRRSIDRAVVTTTFRTTPLRLLRPSHIEEWVKTMQRAGLAPMTIRNRLNHVRAILKGAVRDRVIASDPSVGVTTPRVRRREAAMRIPTPEQVGRLLAAADRDMQPYVALCAFAGLRRGEAAAVRVSDIDFLRRQLRVERQSQARDGGGVEVRAPKYGSERVIAVPDALLELLSQHKPLNGSAEGWLWCTRQGEPLREETLANRWRRIVERAGVSGVKLHDLRH